MKTDAETMTATDRDTVRMSTWVKRGQMMVRRDALDADDPDHPYHYLQATYGVRPEDYGIEKPEEPNTSIWVDPNGDYSGR
jgi:hypothetical protein